MPSDGESRGSMTRPPGERREGEHAPVGRPARVLDPSRSDDGIGGGVVEAREGGQSDVDVGGEGDGGRAAVGDLDTTEAATIRRDQRPAVGGERGIREVVARRRPFHVVAIDGVDQDAFVA